MKAFAHVVIIMIMTGIGVAITGKNLDVSFALACSAIFEIYYNRATS